MVDLPEPPVPPDCDLRDFPFMPIDINRLFGSAFHAKASDSEWRVGFTLWLKSFHQVPAGSLPDDDIEICRLAELGRDVKTWRKVKAMAMHGWYPAADGRLYHDVIAEKTNEAWWRKGEQKARTLKARVAALEKRLNEASNQDDKNHIAALLLNLRQSLSQALERSVTDRTGRAKKSVTETNREGQGYGQGEGQGQGQGQGDSTTSPKTARADSKPQDALFQIWVPWLVERTGRKREACASLAGKWRKEFGNDVALLSAFERCKADGTPDPISWMGGAVRAHKSREPSDKTTQEAMAEIEASGVYDGVDL